MTYISGVRPGTMEHHPWQRRARAAGLTQRTLATLMGRPEITISRQLRGHYGGDVPQHLRAAIVAWELMNGDQREAWIRSAMEKDRK